MSAIDDVKWCSELLEAEWSAIRTSRFCDEAPDRDPACPWCDGVEPTHASGCQFVAIMRKAGLR